LLPEREGGFKTADISQDQRALSLFFGPVAGRSSRISAGQMKSVADNLMEKQQKQRRLGGRGALATRLSARI
jgi:hypothetical protein